ncbi:MAG: PqiC family protein [Nitrospirales bacterium]
MYRLRRGLRNWGLGLCGFAFILGCGSTSPVQYYQLSAMPNSVTEETSPRAEKGTVVGIGPIDIPSYVDRAHLVIRTDISQLEVLESDRWAEPLQKNLARVLIDNLSQELASHGINVLRWDEGLPNDYRVRVEFTQFDILKTGEVSLVARWIIFGKDGQEALIIKTSRFHTSSVPGDYRSLVSEMSRHVESLSQEIANALSATF